MKYEYGKKDATVQTDQFLCSNIVAPTFVMRISVLGMKTQVSPNQLKFLS